MARGRAAALDVALYDRVVAEAKRKFEVWPSAYASGWVTQEYQRRGGAYRGERPRGGGLAQWFGEEWVDVCTPNLQPCGRRADDDRRYPKCRPREDAEAMTTQERKDACRRKRAAETSAARTRSSSSKARSPVRVATRSNPYVRPRDVVTKDGSQLSVPDWIVVNDDFDLSLDELMADPDLLEASRFTREQLSGLRLLESLGAKVRLTGFGFFEGGVLDDLYLRPEVDLGPLESQIVQVVMDDGSGDPFSEVAFRSPNVRGTWQISRFSRGEPWGHANVRGSLSKAFTPHHWDPSFAGNAAVLQITFRDGRTLVREGAVRANPCVPCTALALGLNPSAPPAAKRRLMR